MVHVTINNIPVSVKKGTTIMEAARSAGIHVPHLCFLKEINEIGACRLCCVEVEGEEKLIPACDNVVVEGMKITTNSQRVRRACRTNLQLIMSEHDGDCTICSRNQNCQLQKLAKDFNLLNSRYEKKFPQEKYLSWNKDFPLIRDTKKCVKCMRCIQICDKIQTVKVWDLIGTGSRTRVGVAQNMPIESSDCTLCGQCITHCPVGALRERDDEGKVISAIENPDIITVAQIAPAVRTSWGEEFGISRDFATVNKLAGCLKKIGIDYVFDSCFSADLTIMEEGTEFLHRYKNKEFEEYPMFTSCCPGWIRFVKSQFPEFVQNLSTAKSPQQMFGAVTKNYFAAKIGVPPEKIRCISIMPCVAKKSECELPSMKNEQGIKDVDYVLTTREVVRLLKAERIHPKEVQEVPFDSILQDFSGAGVIFGTTGGVMEAALRTAANLLTGKNPDPQIFAELHTKKITKDKPWRDAVVKLPVGELKIAVANGLGNARQLCEALKRKEVHYDFVEIMACPGGCVGGGGQPINCADKEKAKERGEVLHALDSSMTLRYSHQNQDVQTLYKDFFEKPLSHKAETYLHVNHFM